MQEFPGRPGAISGVGPVRAGSFGKRQEDRRKPVFRFDSSVGVDVTVGKPGKVAGRPPGKAPTKMRCTDDAIRCIQLAA